MPNKRISQFTPTTDPNLDLAGARSGSNFKINLQTAINTLIALGASSGSGAPVDPGSFVGATYIDIDNKALYFWDGSAWQLLTIAVTVDNGNPTVNGVVDGQLYFDIDTGNIWIWDETDTEWVLNKASDANTGVTFVTAPTTLGGKITFSVGLLAENIDETVITYTATPVPTLGMGGVTTTGIQNFDLNYVANYDGSIINYANTTQNYVAPVQTSCETGPVVFGTPYTFPVGTKIFEVTTGISVTMQSINTGTHNYVVDGGEISINTTTTQITVSVVSGSPTFDSLCYYTGNVVNLTETIINNGIFNDSEINNAEINNTVINNPVINNPVLTGIQATSVSIVDTGGYYTSTDVEGALQEIGAEIAGILLTGGIVAGTSFTAQSNANVESPSSGTPTSYRQYTMNKAGTYRHEMVLTRGAGSSSGGVNGQIYKNGVAYGTLHNNNTLSPVTFTEDLSWNAGDTLDVFLRNQSGSFGDNNSFATKFSFDYTSYVTVVNP